MTSLPTPAEITLAGDEAEVKIVVLRYESVRAPDINDSNWLACTVSVRLEQFSAEERLSLTTYDFQRFRDELRQALSRSEGEAVFATYEDGLQIELTLTQHGTGTAKGRLSQLSEPENTLSFSFETDQTLLRRLLEDLEAAIEAYPVKAQ